MPEGLKNNEKKTKKSRTIARSKYDFGPNFVPPDGGWGWMVAFAAGFSNLCTFPVLQQFGILFRDRLANLGISNSQITTIINVHSACTYCIGLSNGPVFRKFSYRQVSFCGAMLVAIALFLTSVANSFASLIITFGVLYGTGIGIATSANSLALNTYFREKRRIATGLSWTATAFGPIIMPYIVNYFLDLYDIQGTLLLFSAFALNAVACSLIFQPVLWHAKTPTDIEVQPQQNQIKCKYCESKLQKENKSRFSSQYLYNADCTVTPGYEIIDPGTPMLSLANDGWFSHSRKRSIYGSKLSMTITPARTPRYDSRKASTQNLMMSTRPSATNLGAMDGRERRDKTKDKNREMREKPREKPKLKLKIEEIPTEDCPSWKAPQDLSEKEKTKLISTPATPRTSIPITPGALNENKYFLDNHSVRSIRKRSNTFNLEKEVLRVASRKLEEFIEHDKEMQLEDELLCTCERERLERLVAVNYDDDDEEEIQYTLWQKIFLFFDLDLLRDYSYVNQMIGITISNFSELNFSILTPFVLSDFGLDKSQIAQVMSILGIMDISVRFFIPFVAGKIGWENRTFFLFGVIGMALGRVVLAHWRTYHVALVVGSWIGLNKGLRTVFMALVIPSHVPLSKLPGATGLQLLFAGIFYIVFGPVIGWIRDASDYTVTLHCLNITTFITAIAWGLEKLYFVRKRKREERDEAAKTVELNDLK